MSMNPIPRTNYGGHKYWVQLPWKCDPPRLTTNYCIAARQLSSLQQHLARHGYKLQHYWKVINEYLQNDFIEEVMNPRVQGHLKVQWPVLIWSSRDRSVINKEINWQFIHFHVGKFAVTADIPKAFLIEAYKKRLWLLSCCQKILPQHLSCIILNVYSLDQQVPHYFASYFIQKRWSLWSRHATSTNYFILCG